MKRTMIMAVLALSAAAGCRQEPPRPASTNETARYAALQLTCESHDRDLQAELSLLRAERALPLLIDTDLGVDPESKTNSALATALATAFGASTLASAIERSDTLFASSVDRWNPLSLEQSLQFRATHTQSQQAVARAVDVPQTRLDLPVAGGAMLSATCANAALVYVRLECIAAADAVSRGEYDHSLAAITRALRLVEVLAAKPHVVTRLTAAVARRDVLGAIQRLVDSRVVTAAHLARLEKIISDQLGVWPVDANAWMGDRALGLQTYEMIRDGQLPAVLTNDELSALQRDESGGVFAAATARNVNQDEAYYLQSMRRYIALTGKSYSDRIPELESLQAERDALADSPQYAIIADRLLLAGVAEGQRQQAADLALVRAWSMALAVACGQSLPPPEVNPLTGDTYDVQIAADRVVIVGIDPHRPELEVRAPIARATRTSSRRNFVTPHQPR